ncbi:GSCFA domain-containing protein [Antarcticibacterium flavum]|uniref:GSCFA domain-containing protein n=1 Tax=Antarcticibacterium flavum TaxID=2058175 RepID=A0A5B7X5Y5_9FLAO|nr:MULTISPECIES: GSCFA domain-containing protein [Antarcticibacterium]MCM4159555.1 GSCFA domain-containing protein [Antarcticibacterium sp. W02-3]QCY70807.1 GSCFA domain-containing protein [Antarcticibacterium flavum]
MEFRTHFKIGPEEPKIDYSSSIFLIGSCFVDNIGRKLEQAKLKSLRNPFGIFYHPAAIENFLSRVVSLKPYTKEEVFHHNERWHCFEAHSVLSNPNREKLLEDLNENLRVTRRFLENATHVIITLGTAFGYRARETGNFVANCHKVPQVQFEKELMPVGEVQERLHNCLGLLKTVNPSTAILFTISPVRHIKDGVIENQRSKSHLLAATGNIVNDKKDTSYFPSYEIMMDDLRDYRFYEKDMLHPNAIAIDYIWNKFIEVWLSKDAVEVMKEITSLQQGLDHRPFNPESTAHKKFKEQLNERIEILKKSFPQIKF